MSRNVTLILAACLLVLAVVGAFMYSGRGTSVPTESAPSNVEPAVPGPPALPPATPPTPAPANPG